MVEEKQAGGEAEGEYCRASRSRCLAFAAGGSQLHLCHATCHVAAVQLAIPAALSCQGQQAKCSSPVLSPLQAAHRGSSWRRRKRLPRRASLGTRFAPSAGMRWAAVNRLACTIAPCARVDCTQRLLASAEPHRPFGMPRCAYLCSSLAPSSLTFFPLSAIPIPSCPQIKQHTSRESCWFVRDGRVYDPTHFLEKHPGGPSAILSNAGWNHRGGAPGSILTVCDLQGMLQSMWLAGALL